LLTKRVLEKKCELNNNNNYKKKKIYDTEYVYSLAIRDLARIWAEAYEIKKNNQNFSLKFILFKTKI